MGVRLGEISWYCGVSWGSCPHLPRERARCMNRVGQAVVTGRRMQVVAKDLRERSTS